MRRIAAAVATLATVLAVIAVAPPAQAGTDRVRPLPQAHAHNDYEHERPLLDALDQGFTSVEADVWLVDGELRVAHDLVAAVPGRTLDSLYLEPLADRVRSRHGSVYSRRGDFQLLIDIKSDGPQTYAAVEKALSRHGSTFTTWVTRRNGTQSVRQGAVQAVISGNRPLADMQALPVRRAAYDGRLSDLASGLSPSFMPLVSANWSLTFSWAGIGVMPAAEHARLRDIVTRAHAAGYRVRFWATPDLPGPARDAVWRELLAAGVDHVNTDDLAGLAGFLREQRFAPVAR